jgi:hypothetical protein
MPILHTLMVNEKQVLEIIAYILFNDKLIFLNRFKFYYF